MSNIVPIRVYSCQFCGKKDETVNSVNCCTECLSDKFRKYKKNAFRCGTPDAMKIPDVLIGKFHEKNLDKPKSKPPR